MSGIGAVVTTRNHERDIVECLKALSFCEERVVVDAFSRDETVRRSLPFAEHIYQRTFTSLAEQRQWGLGQLDTPWALVLDPDERVPPALAEEMIRAVQETEADAFRVRRRTYFAGHLVRDAEADLDAALRLLRRGRESRAAAEGDVRRAGAVGTLRQPLIRRPASDRAALLRRLAERSAPAGWRGDVPARGQLVAAPAASFLRSYLGGGLVEGQHGFVLASLAAVEAWLRGLKSRLAVSGKGPERAPEGAIRVQAVQGKAPRQAGTSRLSG